MVIATGNAHRKVTSPIVILAAVGISDLGWYASRIRNLTPPAPETPVQGSLLNSETMIGPDAGNMPRLSSTKVYLAYATTLTRHICNGSNPNDTAPELKLHEARHSLLVVDEDDSHPA
jgi:hypothetical protein